MIKTFSKRSISIGERKPLVLESTLDGKSVLPGTLLQIKSNGHVVRAESNGSKLLLIADKDSARYGTRDTAWESGEYIRAIQPRTKDTVAVRVVGGEYKAGDDINSYTQGRMGGHIPDIITDTVNTNLVSGTRYLLLNNGTVVISLLIGQNIIQGHTLGTPYDMESVSTPLTSQIFSESTNLIDLFISKDGNDWYVLDNTGIIQVYYADAPFSLGVPLEYIATAYKIGLSGPYRSFTITDDGRNIILATDNTLQQYTFHIDGELSLMETHLESFITIPQVSPLIISSLQFTDKGYTLAISTRLTTMPLLVRLKKPYDLQGAGDSIEMHPLIGKIFTIGATMMRDGRIIVVDGHTDGQSNLRTYNTGIMLSDRSIDVRGRVYLGRSSTYTGMLFWEDGTRILLCNKTDATLDQLHLEGEPFDISAPSHMDRTIDVAEIGYATTDNICLCLSHNRLFIGLTNDRGAVIYQYAFQGKAPDILEGIRLETSVEFTVAGNISSIIFNPSGSRLIICTQTGNSLIQYAVNAGSADLSDGITLEEQFVTTPTVNTPTSFVLSKNGLSLYVSDSIGLSHYVLQDPYNISGITFEKRTYILRNAVISIQTNKEFDVFYTLDYVSGLIHQLIVKNPHDTMSPQRNVDSAMTLGLDGALLLACKFSSNGKYILTLENNPPNGINIHQHTLVGGEYDLSMGYSELHTVDISTNVSIPAGLFLSTTEDKCYILDEVSHKIHEYHFTSNGNLADGITYHDSQVLSEGGSVRGGNITPDGKMLHTCNITSNSIEQYTLDGNAFDISGGLTFAGSDSINNGGCEGLLYNFDGTTVIVAKSNNVIEEYELLGNTPYDIFGGLKQTTSYRTHYYGHGITGIDLAKDSTAVVMLFRSDCRVAVLSFESLPEHIPQWAGGENVSEDVGALAVEFSSRGEDLYRLWFNTVNGIREYYLVQNTSISPKYSIPASLQNNATITFIENVDSNLLDFVMSDDGRTILLLGNNTATIYQYGNIAVPYLLSAEDVVNASVYIGTQDKNPVFLAYSWDGTRLFVGGDDTLKVYQYRIKGDPYTINSGLQLEGSISIPSLATSCRGAFFASAGTALCIPLEDRKIMVMVLSAPFSLLGGIILYHTSGSGSVSFADNSILDNQDRIHYLGFEKRVDYTDKKVPDAVVVENLSAGQEDLLVVSIS